MVKTEKIIELNSPWIDRKKAIPANSSSQNSDSHIKRLPGGLLSVDAH